MALWEEQNSLDELSVFHSVSVCLMNILLLHQLHHHRYHRCDISSSGGDD